MIDDVLGGVVGGLVGIAVTEGQGLLGSGYGQMMHSEALAQHQAKIAQAQAELQSRMTHTELKLKIEEAKCKAMYTKEQAKGHEEILNNMMNSDPVQYYNHVPGQPPPFSSTGMGYEPPRTNSFDKNFTRSLAKSACKMFDDKKTKRPKKKHLVGESGDHLNADLKAMTRGCTKGRKHRAGTVWC